jgi:hypothetical protein
MAMARRSWIAGLLLIVLALGNAGGAGAIEVKKSLYGGGGGPAPSGGGGEGPPQSNPLTPAVQKKLFDAVQSDSESYVGAESEKKSTGEEYVDLENAKLKYFPQNSGGKVQVKAKLEAPEYKASKSGKSKPTGKRKALVFTYGVAAGNISPVGQPAWEDVGDKSAAQ